MVSGIPVNSVIISVMLFQNALLFMLFQNALLFYSKKGMFLHHLLIVTPSSLILEKLKFNQLDEKLKINEVKAKVLLQSLGDTEKLNYF